LRLLLVAAGLLLIATGLLLIAALHVRSSVGLLSLLFFLATRGEQERAKSKSCYREKRLSHLFTPRSFAIDVTTGFPTSANIFSFEPPLVASTPEPHRGPRA
jgi:hypothetical protein